MGTVYLAEDTHLGRRVAVKFPSLSSDSHDFRARFLREARAVSDLNHPGIATLFDYGETPDGRPFLVMELAKGRSLSDLMQSGELSLQREVLALFDRQADLLLPRIRAGAPAMAAASAHTLKGSAVGIGAFKVARAVEQVEQARHMEIVAAVETLAAALEEAKAEIARLLQGA